MYNIPRHNTVVESKDFYISYNFRDRDIYDGDSTAIVIGQMARFYILSGNHLTQLKTCKTFEECMSYFLKNRTEINKRSNKYCPVDAYQVIESYNMWKKEKGYE